jgi:short-subunit dehydrogenase
MRPRGVHVTALCPGMTFTEFHDVNGMRARVSRLPSWLWQDAGTVARAGVDAVERGDARCVTGGVNRSLAALSRYLPETLARALIASHSRDFRDAD